MGDRAAVRGSGNARGGLQLIPVLDHGSPPGGGIDREVRRVTVCVDMCYPAGGDGRYTAAGHRVEDSGVQRVVPVPGARGLERLHDDTEPGERVATVRRP